MLKISNNLIAKSLSLFGVLVLFALVFSPTLASAYTTKAAYKIYEGGVEGGTNTTSNNGTQSTPNNPCQNETPTINSISPSAVNVNSGARKVRVVGTCFTPDSVVRFNSANRGTTYIDSKNLTVDLTANDVKAVGKFLITVQNPKGFSNSKYFTVVKPSAVSQAKKSTTATAVKATSDKLACETGEGIAKESDKNESLVAAAIFAGDDLMPDSLLGWIFLFVFILLAVTLWRRVYVTDKERNAPLKHA